MHFVETEPQLARALFLLSKSDDPHSTRDRFDNSWPFMCVSIMFTKEALQNLRRGSFIRRCNEIQAIFPIINSFHQACFLDFGR